MPEIVVQPIAMVGPHAERPFGGGEGAPGAAGVLLLALELLD